MKRLTYYITMCLAILTVSACSKFDNYDAPSQTLKGVVTVIGTGKGVETEVTTTDNSMTAGTRIRLVEVSWSPTATPQFLGSKQDGSYINTKLFPATYSIIPEGAFVPPVAKTVEVKGGVTDVNFEVEPFLRIEWDGEPSYDASTGRITAKYTIHRGTTNPSYQDNIGDCVLYLNNVQYLGNSNFTLFSRPATPTISAPAPATPIVNTVVSPAVPKGRELYLRIGARIGGRLYNYSTVKSVVVPN